VNSIVMEELTETSGRCGYFVLVLLNKVWLMRVCLQLVHISSDGKAAG
jgi:hypothetical protein